MKRALILPGGGVLGIMQLRVLDEIERQSNRPIHEIFDIIVGTSVGAVNGAVMAYGIPASYFSKLFYEKVDEIFEKSIRIPLVSPLYKRENFIKLYDLVFQNRELKLSELKTKFMATSVNRINKKTEYFKSWKENHKLLDVLIRTFSAPYYFGQSLDYESMSIWFDGGMGTANIPLDVGFTECVKHGWFGNEHLEITCITCGEVNLEPSTYDERLKRFNEMKNDIELTQVLDFIQFPGGGLARIQDAPEKFHRYRIMSENIEKFDFRLINTYIKKEHNSLDAVKYKDVFVEYAEQMKHQIRTNNWTW